MPACAPQQQEYSWQDCEDFQLPENSVWYGKDDDGSDIFCGKAWCDGQEVPAKIIPERRECKVNYNGSERIVPRCRKVLICRGSNDDHCNRRRDHCHRRRRHCHRRDDCSSGSESEEENTTTTTTSSTKNESRLLIRSIKCSSTSTTTVVKKDKKKRRKNRKNGGHHGTECWDERRTRMVPKVTVEPRIRYIPKVTMERTVRYEPETYVTKVCCDDSCEPCEPCDCDPCEDPCEERCKKPIVCERLTSKKEGDRCVRPSRCDPPSPQPKAKCW